jgi:uncharacterized protein (DUF2062 family)/trans-aconitate methyltransferase
LTDPAPSPRPRRHFGRVIAELHVQLRTEGDTPVRKALSVGVGTAVGCLPLYGLHLPLCAGLAKLFGLNRMRTYLAAYIGNPLTLPLFLYVEVGVGSLLFSEGWPTLSFAELRAGGAWGVGRDLLVGSLVVGVVLGAVMAVIAYAVGTRWQAPPLRARLVEEASRRYVEAGIVQWELVRGKLLHDPVYMALLEEGALPRQGLLIDLGCGRGNLLSLLAAASGLHRAGRWPAGRTAPPELALLGVERRPRLAAVAARALAGLAEVREGDLADFAPPPCRAAVLLDVLHYLSATKQAAIIERAAAALEPGGVLVVREADAALGWRFFATRVAERASALARGRWRQRFHYRSAAAWEDLLRGLGLATTRTPMWAGTPYGNVLISARKTAVAAAAPAPSSPAPVPLAASKGGSP